MPAGRHETLAVSTSKSFSQVEFHLFLNSFQSCRIRLGLQDKVTNALRLVPIQSKHFPIYSLCRIVASIVGIAIRIAIAIIMVIRV